MDNIETFDAELGQNDRPESDYPWVLFAIEGTSYGINSKYVLSIEILDTVTPIVDSPHYCPGITEFRDDMISLVDLRALFGMGSYSTRSHSSDSNGYQADDQSMTVVIKVDGNVKGIIVDEIISVENIYNFVDSMTEGSGSGAARSRYLRQIAKREKLNSTVLILDERLLGSL